jgi:hypothetical protein
MGKKVNISRFILFTGITLTLCFQIHAENPIQPDRPGFGTGTYTINPRSVYLELGYTHSFSSLPESPRYNQIPQTNLRYGITNKFEMNIEWDGLIASNGLHSFSSLGIGAKHRLLQNVSYNISFLSKAGFSDIANNFKIEPMLGLLWDYELLSNFETFGVLQLGYLSDQKIFTEISLGIALPIKSKTQLYGEYYIVFLPKQNNIGHHIDIGITYLISNNIQVDAFFATELNTQAYRQFGLGFAKRF